MKTIFRTILLAGVLFSISTNVFCAKQLNSAESTKLEAQIKAASEKTQTLASDFKQTKHIAGMTRDVTSKGSFKYKKTNKIRFDYTSPMKYEMVINGKKIMMVSNGKKTVMNNNASTNQLQNLLTACMTGDMSSLKKYYNICYYDNGSSYLVKVSPKTANKTISDLQITLKKSNKQVESIKMNEGKKSNQSESDYTLYNFANTKANVNLNDNLFDATK